MISTFYGLIIYFISLLIRTSSKSPGFDANSNIIRIFAPI